MKWTTPVPRSLPPGWFVFQLTLAPLSSPTSVLWRVKSGDDGFTRPDETGSREIRCRTDVLLRGNWIPLGSASTQLTTRPGRGQEDSYRPLLLCSPNRSRSLRFYSVTLIVLRGWHTFVLTLLGRLFSSFSRPSLLSYFVYAFLSVPGLCVSVPSTSPYVSGPECRRDKDGLRWTWGAL